MAQAPAAIAGPGDLDPTFNGGRPLIDGSPPTRYEAVTIPRDGEIVVAGTGWRNDLHLVGGMQTPDWLNPRLGSGVVARYNPNGTLDTTFGRGGWVGLVTGFNQSPATSATVQADGRLLVASSSWDSEMSMVMRLHPDGTVDDTFSNGRPTWDPPGVVMPWRMSAAGATALPDGKVLVAGSATYSDPEGGAVAVRLTATGAVDTTYGDAGVARTRLGDGGTVFDVAFLPDGRVVLAGVPNRSLDVAVAGLPRIATLGTGAWSHSLAVALDGSARAWGWNGFGQLGDGTTAERHTPVRVAGTAVFQSATGGAFHSAGVDLAGTVRAWGWNGLGQLCDGTPVDHHVPAPVRLPAGAAVSVAAGAFYSMAG